MWTANPEVLLKTESLEVGPRVTTRHTAQIKGINRNRANEWSTNLLSVTSLNLFWKSIFARWRALLCQSRIGLRSWNVSFRLPWITLLYSTKMTCWRRRQSMEVDLLKFERMFSNDQLLPNRGGKSPYDSSNRSFPSALLFLFHFHLVSCFIRRDFRCRCWQMILAHSLCAFQSYKFCVYFFSHPCLFKLPKIFYGFNKPWFPSFWF